MLNKVWQGVDCTAVLLWFFSSLYRPCIVCCAGKLLSLLPFHAMCRGLNCRCGATRAGEGVEFLPQTPWSFKIPSHKIYFDQWGECWLVPSPHFSNPCFYLSKMYFRCVFLAFVISLSRNIQSFSKISALDKNKVVQLDLKNPFSLKTKIFTK